MALDKLVDSTQLDTDLASVANAIRTKGGTSAQLAFPADFVSAIAAISGGGGGGLEYETGTFTPASDTSNPTISFAKSHSTRPFVALIADLGATQSNGTFIASLVVSYYDLYGQSLFGDKLYGRYDYFRANNTAVGSTGTTCSSTANTSGGLDYYVTNSEMKGSRSSNAYFRSSRTYTWIAIWAPTT